MSDLNLNLSLAMRAQAARGKVKKPISRSTKRAEIMEAEFSNLVNLVNTSCNLETEQDKPSTVVAEFYQPLCIKDDYGKEHIVPRELCYAWLEGTDPESDAITWLEMLTGVYNSHTGKTEPHRLPHGKTLIMRLNDWLAETENPLMIRLEKTQSKKYIRPHDNKCCTRLKIIAIRDIVAYKEQLQQLRKQHKRA